MSYKMTTKRPLDASSLQASLSQHQDLLAQHKSLDTIHEDIAALKRTFKNESQAFIRLAKKSKQLEAEPAMELFASKTLDRGHQIITRAVEACKHDKAFTDAYKKAVSQMGQLMTSNEIANELSVSTWHVDAIMHRSGAEQVHVGVEAHAKTFWRVEDCDVVKSQRKLS